MKLVIALESGFGSVDDFYKSLEQHSHIFDDRPMNYQIISAPSLMSEEIGMSICINPGPIDQTYLHNLTRALIHSFAEVSDGYRNRGGLL